MIAPNAIQVSGLVTVTVDTQDAEAPAELECATIEVCIGDEQRCLHTFSPPDESPCYEQDECTDAPVERIECADGICVCTMDGGEVGSCAGECDGWGTPLSFAACCPDPTL